MSINAPNLQQLGAGLDDKTQQALRSVLSAQSDFNSRLAALLNVAQKPQVPQYINGWVDFGQTTKSQYWLLPFGLAHLSLTMKSGTIGSNAFVLPIEFAPTYDITTVAYTNQAGNEAGKLVIFGVGSTSAGAVLPATGNNSLYAVEMTWVVN